MKQQLISDLYKLLFSIPFDSAKDQWDLNTKLGRAFLNFHSVCFKDKEDIQDSQYWKTDDVEEHFYDLLCPGGFVSVIQFEDICEQYLELDMWEKNKRLNDIAHSLQSAINKITKTYGVLALASQKDDMIMIEPVSNLKAAS